MKTKEIVVEDTTQGIEKVITEHSADGYTHKMLIERIRALETRLALLEHNQSNREPLRNWKEPKR